jgi:hypothetical protein
MLKKILWFIPVTLALLNVGLSSARTNAQTIFDFDTFYDTAVVLEPLTPPVTKATITGVNPNAPYGLTNFSSLNYSQFNPATETFTFVPDATRFGVEGLPVGMDMYFGSGEDKLFGLSDATAVIDRANNLLNGTGTVTITGGEGRFIGATGTFRFTESEPLNEDPTAPLKGRAFIKGTFQVPQRVPEPKTHIGLIGVAVVGVSLLSRNQLRKCL